MQKDLGKGSSAYVGIDNILNHRDDNRALQQRVYRIGVNLTFGPDADTEMRAKMAEEKPWTLPKDRWFIVRPFDAERERGVRVIGDYRARWNAFTGKIKPSEARVTTTSSVGTAYKNYLEKAEHGFEQRLRAGVDARVGDNTNIRVLGSAAGTQGVDTVNDVSKNRGLSRARLDEADVTQHVGSWDLSLGRLTEPMGITGYYFGKEYDGARAVWTGQATQVRLGYGTFRHSTGIHDSAYTHATYKEFLRPPTKLEWLGFKRDEEDNLVPLENGNGLYQRLLAAATPEEANNILKKYLDVVKASMTPEQWTELRNTGVWQTVPTHVWKKITVRHPVTNAVVGTYMSSDVISVGSGIREFLDPAARQRAIDERWNDFSLHQKPPGHVETYEKDVTLPDGTSVDGAKVTEEVLFYGKYNGNKPLIRGSGDRSLFDPVRPFDEMPMSDFTVVPTEEEAKRLAAESLVNPSLGMWQANEGYYYNRTYNGLGMTQSSIVRHLLVEDWKPEDDSLLPLHLLEKYDEFAIRQRGAVLVQDSIPALDRALFVQARHEVTPQLGVAAFYLRSVGDRTHTMEVAHDEGNDVHRFSRLANVIGIGAAWQAGRNLRVSADWGRNITAFGRFMNGETVYEHTPNTANFVFKGRRIGSNPTFWTLRFDVGESDTNRRRSWNAFLDYKHFAHGSFFGGNGTESVPDRYMDGIKSFTLGAGYVPMENLLVEAFYTFDARGIGKRDTLYGAEKFKLGDYFRMQVTYKF